MQVLTAPLFQPTIPVFTSLFALVLHRKAPQLSCNNASDSRIVYAGWLAINVLWSRLVDSLRRKQKNGGASSSAAANNKVFGEILTVRTVYVALSMFCCKKKWCSQRKLSIHT